MLVVPHTRGGLRFGTAQWMARNAELEPLPVFIQSEFLDAYWINLKDWWAQPGDLVIVEQDMLPAPNVVQEMLKCDHDWCSSPYLIDKKLMINQGLGCVKFSERLRQAHPDMAEMAGEPSGEDEPHGVWWMLDNRLAHHLMKADYQVHEHEPSVHLHHDHAVRSK